MKISIASAQHIGQRENQEDQVATFSIKDVGGSVRHDVGVVCDGMGGMSFGEDASIAGIKEFVSHYSAALNDEQPKERLKRAIKYANREVYYQADKLEAIKRMGTTVAAAAIVGGKLYVANVGDSRVYLCRPGILQRLEQVSFDHTFDKKLLQRVVAGSMSAAEAAQHPARESLTSHLGLLDLPDEYYSPAPIALNPGDWVVVCSDGLFGTLKDTQITQELYGSPDAAAKRLVQKVVSANFPDQDNVSVVVMLVEAPMEPSSRTYHSHKMRKAGAAGDSLVASSKRKVPAPVSISGTRSLAQMLRGVTLALGAFGLVGLGYSLLRPNEPSPQEVVNPVVQKGFDPVLPTSKDSGNFVAIETKPSLALPKPTPVPPTTSLTTTQVQMNKPPLKPTAVPVAVSARPVPSTTTNNSATTGPNTTMSRNGQGAPATAAVPGEGPHLQNGEKPTLTLSSTLAQPPTTSISHGNTAAHTTTTGEAAGQ